MGSTTESDCFSKLYMKYGTPKQVSNKLIADIENSKPPGANAIEGFLISIIVTAEYIEAEKQTVIITPERITKCLPCVCRVFAICLPCVCHVFHVSAMCHPCLLYVCHVSAM